MTLLATTNGSPRTQEAGRGEHAEGRCGLGRTSPMRDPQYSLFFTILEDICTICLQYEWGKSSPKIGGKWYLFLRDSYSALLGWLSHARCPPPWPFSPGPGGHLEATSLREVPASLALLARAREAAPHARCQPPWPYSPAPGREAAPHARCQPGSRAPRPYSHGLAEQATLLLAPSSAHPWRRSGRT